LCLVPIRGWPHRVTRASNGCAGGGALSVVEPSLSLQGGGWGEVFAVGAKLRRVGPMTTASGAYCIAGARDAAVVWAGGLHSGWNARMRTGWGSARRFRQRKGSVPPFGEQFSLGFGGEKKNSVAIQAPSLGRERPLVARPECVKTGDAFFGGTRGGWDCPPLRLMPVGTFTSLRGFDLSARPAGVGLGTVWLGGWWLFYLRWTRGEGLLGASATTRTEGVEG
jgi:hypothetical protein